MSLIWHMVNRSLLMFCSEFGPSLDHPRSLPDDQSSASSNSAEKHYSGLCHQDSPSELSSSRTGPRQGDCRLQGFLHKANHELILSRSRDRLEGGPGSLLGSPGPGHLESIREPLHGP